jgi:hypothetical protein
MNRTIEFTAAVMIILVFAGCSVKKGLEAPPPEPVEPGIPADAYLWVIKPNINVRMENSASSRQVSTLADGDSVIVHGNEKGWYEVETTGGARGWVRSDLLAPRDASIFRQAVEFVDRLKADRNTDLFFDKKLQHARIYLSFPPELYGTREEVEKRAREIATEYQSKVFRGDVTVRVLRPGSEEEYLTFEQKGRKNPEVVLPVIPYGKLKKVDHSDPAQIHLAVSVNPDIGNEQLLEAARSMVRAYPLSYEKVVITFVNPDDSCRLWFIEDAAGELYRFDECPEE